MADDNYTIRAMTAADVPQVLECYTEMDLAENTHNIYTWLEVDKDCGFVAVTDKGKVIGVCCTTYHEDANLYFLGFYIVRGEYRGKGIGKACWDACMKRVGSANIALNAVPDKTELYRLRGGFPIVEPNWTLDVYQSKTPVDPSALSDSLPEGVVLLPYEESLLQAMHEYDHALVGYRRLRVLQLSCKEEGSRTFVAMRGGKCVGFGTIKTSFQNMGKVGPMYGDESFGEALLKKLLLSLPDVRGLCFMPISTNKHVKVLLEKIGCPFLEPCPRLYRFKKHDIDTQYVYSHWDCNFCPY